MDYDKEKVDEMTLALMYLVAHNVEAGYSARAWKGFDWATMNRLHDKDLISNPVGKAKSVALTDEAYQLSKTLFKKHFALAK
jgi:Domain of unknown function (DUF6429)